MGHQNLERMKSLVLCSLVGLSIYLTWQLWTFQPHYEYLLPAEYVTHEGIAEKREMDQLVRPYLIANHYGEDTHTVTYPDMFQYSAVIESQMKNWYFYNFRKINWESGEYWLRIRQENEGLELIFPTAIPFQLLQDIFHIRFDDADMPPMESVLIYTDTLTNEVFALFFSYENQSVYRADTGISPTELRNYIALGEYSPQYETRIFGNPYSLRPVHYLSTQPMSIVEYRYFYQRINVNLFIPYLFVDPSLVRLIEDNIHGQFYTDGTRGLNLFQRGSSMYFMHPASQYEESESLYYVERSVNFVNQHQGWSDSYYLFNVDHEGRDGLHEVEYRKFIGNYPVFAEPFEEERNTIEVEVQNDRVTGYYRSLVNVDRVMTQISRELPPATDVIWELERRHIPLESIKKIYTGYLSRFEDYYVTYQPCWVIERDNGDRLFIRQIEKVREESTNELE